MKQKWSIWLFNPFMYIAGWQAMAAGLLVLLATIVAASFSCIRFDGVLDIHLGDTLSMAKHAGMIILDYACLSLLLCVSGILFSKSQYRFIDIAATQLVARWPLIWIALLALVVNLEPVRDAAKQLDPQEIQALFTAPFLVFLVASVLVTVWMIVLMYRSYTVSFNLSGNKAILSFIVCLLAAEILSKIIILKYIL